MSSRRTSWAMRGPEQLRKYWVVALTPNTMAMTKFELRPHNPPQIIAGMIFHSGTCWCHSWKYRNELEYSWPFKMPGRKDERKSTPAKGEGENTSEQ